MVPGGPSVLQSMSLCPPISDPSWASGPQGYATTGLSLQPPGGELTEVPTVLPFCMLLPGPPRSWGHPGLAHSAQASPEDQAVQGTNCLGGGLSNRSPSGARAGWPRAGRPQSHCLQTPAVEIGIPDSRERGPEAPWSRARPQAASHEGPSWDPPHCPLLVPAITVHQAPGLPPAECGS